VVISNEQVAETWRQWEAETGRCSHCGGSGQQVKSISVTEGASYRTCSGCGGTGKTGGGSVQP
jgi:DnaJ-class molecular chaperone